MDYSHIDNLDYGITQEGVHELLHGKGAAKMSLLVPLIKARPLQEALQQERKVDMLPSPTIGIVYQDFTQKMDFQDVALIEKLENKLRKTLLEKLYVSYGLQPVRILLFDSIILQHYPLVASKKSFAIPPHQDHKAFVELIVILLVEGGSYFYIAEDKHQKKEVYINAKPMDLIVMRGYDFAGKGDMRPVHYVKKIQGRGGRTSLTIRMLSKNKEHLATLEQAFGTAK